MKTNNLVYLVTAAAIAAGSRDTASPNPTPATLSTLTMGLTHLAGSDGVPASFRRVARAMLKGILNPSIFTVIFREDVFNSLLKLSEVE